MFSLQFSKLKGKILIFPKQADMIKSNLSFKTFKLLRDLALTASS